MYELYHYGFEYDKVIHLVSPLIATIALGKHFGLRRAIFIIALLAIGWKFFEFISDALIKTHLFGVYRQHIWIDTAWDLVMNSIGVILGSWIFSRTGFGGRSTEKSPTENSTGRSN